MRLKDEEITAIKNTVSTFDIKAKIYLFGSRVDKDKKGGDIDLLIISDTLTHKDERAIRLDLYDKLGEQKIDIIIACDDSDPFVRIALNEGTLL